MFKGKKAQWQEMLFQAFTEKAAELKKKREENKKKRQEKRDKREKEKEAAKQKRQAEAEQAKASQRQPASRLKPAYAYAGAGAIGGAALGGGLFGGRRMVDAAAKPSVGERWDKLWNPQSVNNAANRIIVQPMKGIGSNAGSLIKWFLIFFIIFSAFYYMWPTLRNQGWNSIQQGIGVVTWTLTDGMQQFFQTLNCAMGGECVPKGDPVDNTKYGINIGNVYTTKRKFQEWDNVLFKARPEAILMKDMDTGSCAEVYCSLDDGTYISQTHDCIPLNQVSRVTITCEYGPLISKTSSSTRLASIGLLYPFQTKADLPLSMVNPTKYEEVLENAFDKNPDLNLDGAEKEVAKYFSVTPKPAANPKLTPLLIGARIDSNQPIPIGAPYTTLLVTVTNTGEGMASIEGLSVDLPSGVVITRSSEPSASMPDSFEFIEGEIRSIRSLFKKENLQGLTEEMEPGEIRDYDFQLDTSGFQLEGNQNEATTRKIYITVDYTYNISKSTYVEITTCDEIGGCKEEGEETAAQEEEPVEPPQEEPAEQPAEV